MSDFKQWERESKIEVSDVERWDDTRTQLRGAVFDSETRPFESHLIQENEGYLIRDILNIYNTDFVSTTSASFSIENTTNVIQNKVLLEDATIEGWSTNDESNGTPIPLATNNIDGQRRKSILFEFDVKRYFDQLNERILSDLTVIELSQKILDWGVNFFLKMRFSPQSNSSAVYLYTRSTNVFQRIVSSTNQNIFPERVTNLFENYPDCLTSDGRVYLLFADQSNFDVFGSRLSSSFSYPLSLAHLFLTNEDSYTKAQTDGVIAGAIAGERMLAYAPKLTFVDDLSTEGVSQMFVARRGAFAVNPPVNRTWLNTNRQAYGSLDESDRIVIDQILGTGHTNVTGSNFALITGLSAFTFQLDVIGYYQTYHPGIFPKELSREENVLRLKQMMQTEAVIDTKDYWLWSRSQDNVLGIYAINETGNGELMDSISNIPSTVANAQRRNFSFKISNASRFITSDGYFIWYLATIGNSTAPGFFIRRYNPNQVSQRELPPMINQSMDIYLKMSDFYFTREEGEALKREVEELKNG